VFFGHIFVTSELFRVSISWELIVDVSAGKISSFVLFVCSQNVLCSSQFCIFSICDVLIFPLANLIFANKFSCILTSLCIVNNGMKVNQTLYAHI